MSVKKLLTHFQRTQLLSIESLTSEEFLSYFTLSTDDIKLINKHRGDVNKLGFAFQLCLLRYPGVALSNWTGSAVRLLDYIAIQLKINNKNIDKYNRKNTLSDHLNEILFYYDYKKFDVSVSKKLEKFIIKKAMENEDTMYLIKSSINFCHSNRVLLPPIAGLEQLIGKSKEIADNLIFSKLTESLTSKQIEQLDDLLPIRVDSKQSTLAWIKDLPGKANPEGFNSVCNRFKVIVSINLSSIDISTIHRNRLLQLSRLGGNYDAYDFSRFNSKKKYALLVAFLIDYSQYLIDQLIEIHDRIITTIKRKGIHASQERLKEKGKLSTEKLGNYVSLVSKLDYAKNNGLDPFEEINNFMTWSDVLIDVEETKQITGRNSYGYMELVRNKASYLRKYTASLLTSLEFKATPSAESTLVALKNINDLNVKGKRKFPATIPLDFVNKKWENLVKPKSGEVDRSYFELIALTELKNKIRSGDIAVEGSLSHRHINDYLVTLDNCKHSKTIPDNFDDYLVSRAPLLDERLHFYNHYLTSNENMPKNKKLSKEPENIAELYRKKLYSLIPSIRLSDLLIEVDSWTNFTHEFIHDSTNKPPNDSERKIVLATLLGLGMNIGLEKMAQSTPGISYAQMANAKHWRFYKESLQRVQATLVNHHMNLEIVTFWGKGHTSSSDGMRVPVGVASIESDVNPHYKSLEKGATMIRSVNDMNTTHHVTVVSTNTRDATHTIDGLLYHETELELEEHYTDTNGYTDHVFGVCALLGQKYEPRIRNVKKSQLFSIKESTEYKKLNTRLNGKINLKLIEENYDEIKRILYSIQTGEVTCSLILSKLGSYARKNKVAIALQELGRIEKSIFLVEYLTDEELRKKITRGLNKGEAINALARELFFGQRGKFMERDIRRQLQSASALNILINAISIWNSVYLQKAYHQLVKTDPEVKKYMPYITPINWKHITFLGEYKFDLNTVPDGLRDLVDPK